jgi:hypothetical protein
VQRSKYPDKYDNVEADARALLAHLAGGLGAGVGGAAGGATSGATQVGYTAQTAGLFGWSIAAVRGIVVTALVAGLGLGLIVLGSARASQPNRQATGEEIDRGQDQVKAAVT